ncbi:transcriptional regulator, MarR family [Noviherbaspirillum humi]|uniref:Transcriptional regulator, MarR family n=1 Tax=Noviherbaspirillum humi TaxID=1688639 RepID=A0A239G763_9BURK|nr:MarR family transcriptional regulator [Noviherbaspirillum humi]SNS64618.1 transcriptional regulator, MarR family [Noviherbaspirillum humi]
MPKTRDTEHLPLAGLESVFMDLYAQPGHLFRRAQQIAVSVFYDVVGDAVTPIQYALLRMLYERPGIDQKTLAGLVALDTVTTATTAERLEAKKLIVRHVDPANRRQKQLYLTDEGKALLASLVEGVRRMHGELFRDFQPQERDALINLMHKFVDSNNERSRAPLRTAGTVARKPGPRRKDE